MPDTQSDQSLGGVPRLDDAPDRLAPPSSVMDTDGDGVRDGVEIKVLGRDATVADEFDERLGRDRDQDGLSDLDEIVLGSDQLKADSDRDGVLDGREVDELRTDPLQGDTDNDGVADGVEQRMGTDALRRDSDRDGIRDGREALRYDTDATNSDTDGDGVVDGLELLLETDPLQKEEDVDIDVLSPESVAPPNSAVLPDVDFVEPLQTTVAESSPTDYEFPANDGSVSIPAEDVTAPVEDVSNAESSSYSVVEEPSIFGGDDPIIESDPAIYEPVDPGE